MMLAILSGAWRYPEVGQPAITAEVLLVRVDHLDCVGIDSFNGTGWSLVAQIVTDSGGLVAWHCDALDFREPDDVPNVVDLSDEELAPLLALAIAGKEPQNARRARPLGTDHA